MELGEYGLTRGTCFVARRLEVVAVSGLLWTSCCVLVGRIFVYVCVCIFFFFAFFLFERTRPVASMRPPCLIYLSTSILAIGSMVAGASRFLEDGAVAAWSMGYSMRHAGPRPGGSFRDRIPASTCVRLG